MHFALGVVLQSTLKTTSREIASPADKETCSVISDAYFKQTQSNTHKLKSEPIHITLVDLPSLYTISHRGYGNTWTPVISRCCVLSKIHEVAYSTFNTRHFQSGFVLTCGGLESGGLESGGLESGSLESRSTDFGSGIVLTCLGV